MSLYNFTKLSPLLLRQNFPTMSAWICIVSAKKSQHNVMSFPMGGVMLVWFNSLCMADTFNSEAFVERGN